MKFINREKELRFLDKYYTANQFQFIPVYGRRRLGKTRLFQEFIRGRDAIYYLADSVSETEQLKNLGRIVAEYFSDLILADAGFRDWYQFFAYLKDRHEGRLLVVIDEFPYLTHSNPAISSIFQKGIDQYLNNTMIFMVLMGSSIGMMEKEVLFYKAPLYGRRSASLEVESMPFIVLKEFFPGKNFDELLQIYSIMGTVPAYLEKYDPKRKVLENIADLILEKGSFFYSEVEYLLREELREPRNYFVILRAIAQGKRKLSEIINDTGFEKSLVSRYLDILRNLGFVEKEIPITEKVPEKSKQGLYRLYDRFFTFWFKYVFPHRSRVEIGNIAYVLGLIGDSFEQYVSTAYEDVCIELCGKLMSEGVIQYTLVGRWWSRNEEIDIVALDEETNTAYFGECKWSTKKVGEDVYKELIRKASLVDWRTSSRREWFILFSRSGFTQGMMEISRTKNILLVHGDTLLGREFGRGFNPQ